MWHLARFCVYPGLWCTIPLAVFQSGKVAASGGLALIGAVALMVIGIVFIARAGKIKERDLAPNSLSVNSPAASLAPRTPFSLGLLIFVISGVLSSLVNFSFIYGLEIAATAAIKQHR